MRGALVRPLGDVVVLMFPLSITEDEIIERTQYALINEGAKILEEGIALRAVDIDIIYLNGYGYPAYSSGYYGGYRRVYRHRAYAGYRAARRVAINRARWR